LRSSRSLTQLAVLIHLQAGASIAAAQDARPAVQTTVQTVDTERKQARAQRVPNGAIRLDGRLSEAPWLTAPLISDFVQREPNEGAAASDRMEVRFVYDDSALYVGARMQATDAIQAPMGRRDSGDQAERVLVSLDTYLDRRTASTFGVTAAGVRLDHYYASDDDWNEDEGFDPVWQVRTAMDDTGWTAEFWIPFAQLRFNTRSPQVWGLNVQRIIPSSNEETFWSLVPRTEERWASLFGDLHGIDGIQPTRRLELLPYSAAGSRLEGEVDRDNPFSGGAHLEGRVGLDMKMGLGSNLTLEGTVNPDFGQVEADPSEVNLSAFETFFDERRPFFIEGSQLLSGPVNNYFYSRRIGAAPPADAEGDFVESPGTTNILGAAKITGRRASGMSIGVLGAITGEEFARTFDSPATFGRARVAPPTTYGVARVQQELGPSGSSVGLMSTGVRRSFDSTDPLASLLTQNAFSLSGDAVVRFRDGEYEVQPYAGMSYVNGSTDVIDRLQRSSARYLHRPDATHLSYDPTRTSLSGVKAGVEIERRTGRHWLWEASAVLESPEFETNDIGRLTSSDGRQLTGQIEYRDTEPGAWWRNYAATISQSNEWNFGGERQSGSVTGQFEMTWPNFWETTAGATFNVRSQDSRLTRGGPSMERPSSWLSELEVETSDATRTRGSLSAEYGRDEDGGLTFGLEATLALQPGPRWELTLGPSYEREVNTQQYIQSLPGGPASTFGGRHVFARIDRSTYAAEVRMNYTFKPDLTLDFYAEPFSASGRYDRFGQLMAARARQQLVYGTSGTTVTEQPDGSLDVTDGGSRFTLRNRNFNVRELRSNLVLRWEWRPGSTLYLVWQQDREEEEMSRARASVGDMFRSFGSRGDHVFAVKASFWFSPR
jgi:hypothetical protein